MEPSCHNEGEKRSRNDLGRGEGSLPRLEARAHRAVGRADPQLAVSGLRTLAELVDHSLRQFRVRARTISGSSQAALMLAAMGSAGSWRGHGGGSGGVLQGSGGVR